MTNHTTTPTVTRPTWTAPRITVARMQHSQLEITVQSSDGVLGMTS